MKKSRIDTIVGALMVFAITLIWTSEMASAVNWQDTDFNFSILYGGYGYRESGPRNKDDTSKVYFVNNSTNQIDLSIYGAGNSNVFSNCTYNTGNSDHTYPYAVTPTTTNHYYSSVVRERYGTGAKAKLHCGAVVGSYSTVWSPDNYYGH